MNSSQILNLGRTHIKKIQTMSVIELQSYTRGEYPLVYISPDDQCHCDECAGESYPAVLVNWNDDDVSCDNCGQKIDAAEQ